MQEHSIKNNAKEAFLKATQELLQCGTCEPKDKVGLVAYYSNLWNHAAPILSSFPEIVGAVVNANGSNKSSLASAHVPVLRHFAGKQPDKVTAVSSGTEFYYPKANDYRFAIPFGGQFDYVAESVSHTRSLAFLKPLMNGPYFDLEKIWDEHTYYEIADRSVEHTMSTMVEQPYVNHIPTLTGGIGRGKDRRFRIPKLVVVVGLGFGPITHMTKLITERSGMSEVLER